LFAVAAMNNLNCSKRFHLEDGDPMSLASLLLPANAFIRAYLPLNVSAPSQKATNLETVSASFVHQNHYIVKLFDRKSIIGFQSFDVRRQTKSIVHDQTSE
jgi:hypothetical protein